MEDIMKKIISLAVLAAMLLTLVPFAVSASDISAVTATGEAKKLDLDWVGGYVGSSTNSSNADKLSSISGSLSSTYRYSEVITIAEKGTTIYFHDPDSGIASSNAYTVSSWKKDTDGVVLDKKANSMVRKLLTRPYRA